MCGGGCGGGGAVIIDNRDSTDGAFPPFFKSFCRINYWRQISSCKHSLCQSTEKKCIYHYEY